VRKPIPIGISRKSQENVFHSRICIFIALPIPLGLGNFIQKIDDFHFPTIENCPQGDKKGK
jgi:hypothetical protein